MEDWFLWFLCGCYLVGGMSIGYWFSEWMHRKDKKGTGRPEGVIAILPGGCCASNVATVFKSAF